MRQVKIGVDTENEVPALIAWRKGCALEQAPLVLALHQTTDNPEHGMQEPMGLKGNPDLFYGLELAQKGALVLAPAYPYFSEYAPDLDLVYGHWGYDSMSQKAFVNHARCIDVLTEFARGQRRAVSCIGHSLGGTNAAFLAAFDGRCKAFVCSAGLSTFASYHQHMEVGLAGWARPEKYMPLIAGKYKNLPENLPADFDDVLVAARQARQFISAPLDDDTFPSYGAKKAFERAQTRVPGAENRFIQPKSGHNFPKTVRKKAYAFLLQR